MLYLAYNGIPAHGCLRPKPLKNDALHRRGYEVLINLLLEGVAIDAMDICAENRITQKFMLNLHGTLHLRGMLHTAIVPDVRRDGKREHHKKDDKKTLKYG